jgi:excisionase family DNA binding protein
MSEEAAIRNPQSEIQGREILKPREAAEYLSVHVRTLYRLVKRGDIPGRKVGGSWRFKKGSLDEWLACKGIPSKNEEEQ